VLTLLSIIYGYTSGRFLSFADVVQALVYLPASVADYFVTLFMASQFLACFHYMLAAPQPTLGQLLTDEVVQEGVLPVSLEIVIMIILYGIPLLTSVLRIYVKR
jgi:p-aminobenzoyl-glutamate transporter AbgT